MKDQYEMGGIVHVYMCFCALRYPRGNQWGTHEACLLFHHHQRGTTDFFATTERTDIICETVKLVLYTADDPYYISIA